MTQLFSNGKNAILNIDYMGVSSNVRKTKFGPAVREEYIVHYVLDGSGYFNGARVEKGEGFLIYPGQKQHYYPDNTNPWRFVWIVARDEKMQEIFNLYDADKDTQVFDYDFLPDLVLLAKEIEQTGTSFSPPYQLLERYARLLKLHEERHEKKQSERTLPSYYDFSLQYIRANLSQGVSVKKLTEVLGVSQPYLYRIFRQNTGKSPKQYIDDYRLFIAKKYLRRSDDSVTQVAKSVGFDDVLSFSRFFLKKQNQSPTAYRNQYKK